MEVKKKNPTFNNWGVLDRIQSYVNSELLNESKIV